MSKFEEIMSQARGILQGLLNDSNVDKVAEGAKALDALTEEYKASEKEAQSAKDNLVKYVGEYAFKDKGSDDTHTEETPTLDDLFEKEFTK